MNPLTWTPMPDGTFHARRTIDGIDYALRVKSFAGSKFEFCAMSNTKDEYSTHDTIEEAKTAAETFKQ